MKTLDYQPTVTRADCVRLTTQLTHAATLADAADMVDAWAVAVPFTSHWRRFAHKLAAALRDSRAAFPIIAMQGNTKLPFAAFSALPGRIADGGTCDSAGECLGWCYSYRAWRYPAAFFRQVQNTLLLRFAHRLIRDAFLALPQSITFRLYVDGDFNSIGTATLWFNLLRVRPDIQCYGYSKSWDILAAYHRVFGIPPNYMLNLSSGGTVQRIDKAAMLALPFVRGEFIAVPLSRKHSKGFKRYTEHDYHVDVVQAARANGIRAFSCPGQCGACSKHGHACGSTRFTKLTIAIGIH